MSRDPHSSNSRRVCIHTFYISFKASYKKKNSRPYKGSQGWANC